MLIKSLSLQNFRSFNSAEFQFHPRTTIIIGPNASGKTNILESLYLLASCRSFRANLIGQMISAKQEFSRVSGRVVRGDQEQAQISILLTNGYLQGRKMPKRKYFINNVSRQPSRFLEQFRAVIFRPEDIDLILSGPRIRRDYLDSVLSAVDVNYQRADYSYKKGLRRRNKILESIRQGRADASALFFYNQLLVKNGQIITSQRKEFIRFINQLVLEPGFPLAPDISLRLDYRASPVSAELLDKNSAREVRAGMTLFGPHRDQLFFFSASNNLHAYGSRGQQRMAVLALKLAELEFVARKFNNERPVLLLDDIFSELDQKHRQVVLQTLARHQSVITATDKFFISALLPADHLLINLPAVKSEAVLNL